MCKQKGPDNGKRTLSFLCVWYILDHYILLPLQPLKKTEIIGNPA